MIDQNFPIINFDINKSHFDNGVDHGKAFSAGIKELVEIRKNLLFQRNPGVKNKLKELARKQLEVSEQFSPEITSEMKGIAKGAEVSLEDIVILNNYTDFRDIPLPDEGCSTLHVRNEADEALVGQTWDMHKSAKNYVCIINVPKTNSNPAQVLFSLVGCVGMMGFNSNDLMVAVNNINTQGAVPALIWPVLVRHSLTYSSSFEELRKNVTEAPVSSGHNYLLSSSKEGEHWEVSPQISEVTSKITPETSFIYHTNHCLGEKTKMIEDKQFQSTTTHQRYELLTKKLPGIDDLNKFTGLLQDHEGYPKSICSHFETSSQDPSSTCGGASASFKQNTFHFWRGCPIHDENHLAYNFKLDQNRSNFIKA